MLHTFALLLAAGLQSGQPIPVGAPEGRGPLAAGLTSYPAGVARVYGSAAADLFVVAGRFSSPPGLFLYRWKATAPDGRPVFGERVQVRQPSAEESPVCAIWQEGAAVHGLFLEKRHLIHARYEHAGKLFREESRISIESLPRAPQAMTALRQPDGSYELVFHLSDGTSATPPGPNWRDPLHVPYDGAGIWRGGLPYLALFAARVPSLASGRLPDARMISSTAREVLWSNRSLTVVNLGPGRRRDLVSGSRFGDLYYFHNRAENGLELEARRHVADAGGIALRHPTITPTPVAWPNPRTGLSDLIAGGEGALYYYRFAGRFHADGRPVYHAPVAVLEDRALLFSGTLGVPTQVDWDGDGAIDLVCGNSEGLILFFKNTGGNAAPAFLPGVPLEAGGRVIQIQPGYRGDIQGPGEARWGYVSPNVADWNGDGLPDVLMSDSLAQHSVCLNRGTRRQPRLDAPHPLYLDGLDLHGTWRVRPAVAKLDGRMAYVANDDQDQFHLYWRIDDYNLADGGKLRMEDGSAIGANFTGAGGTGRSKLELVDWDADGKVDLLVGTPRHHAVPNPTTGLPRALGLPGATVLFLRNVGTNAQPRFRFPVMLEHEGKPIYMGQHEIGVSAGMLGAGSGPSLVVSREDGRLFFFRRASLSGHR